MTTSPRTTRKSPRRRPRDGRPLLLGRMPDDAYRPGTFSLMPAESASDHVPGGGRLSVGVAVAGDTCRAPASGRHFAAPSTGRNVTCPMNAVLPTERLVTIRTPVSQRAPVFQPSPPASSARQRLHRRSSAYPAADGWALRDPPAHGRERDGARARPALRLRGGTADAPDPTPRGVRGAHGALRSLAAGDLPTCARNRDPADEGAWGFRARPAANALWARSPSDGSDRITAGWTAQHYPPAVRPGSASFGRTVPPLSRAISGG